MENLKNQIETLAKEELERANEKFPLFHSDHEGLGVLEEEMFEVGVEWECAKDVFDDFAMDVFKDEEIDKIIDIQNMKKYAINACAEIVQVIAMCDKFIDSRIERNE